MAQKVQVKAKPPINIERFAMWKMMSATITTRQMLASCHWIIPTRG